MTLDPATELKKFSDGESVEERIREWLETPQGTLADLPAWGHNLGMFKHEPQGVDLEVMAEMAIMIKMPLDIEDLVITGVSVEFESIDLCRITIHHRLGIYEETISL